MDNIELDRQLVRKIIDNPVDCYVEFYCRLKKDGANACFPEFEPTVNYLQDALESDEFKEILDAHQDLSYELKEVKTLFAHINLKFAFEDEAKYPYPKPFEGPFPYRPTIDAIEAALRLLDKLNRLQPGNKAVALYHFDRYAYHRHALVSDHEVIVYPTITELKMDDLIRVRSVPIGFIGVVERTIRVDRHQQSPLDFWYHDMNHVRRMQGYTSMRERALGIEFDMQKSNFFWHMDKFLSEVIMPNIDKAPEGTPEDDNGVRRLVRVIMFEIFHESALTAERESVIEETLRPNMPQPFEHMIYPEADAPEDIEELRTPTGNLQSGISNSKTRGAITVRFFHDRALSLLGNVYNKLNYGFYDDPENTGDGLVAIKYRTPEWLLKAAKKVFEILDYKDYPSDEEIMNLITSKEGSEEKFVYKSLMSDDPEVMEQFATEPTSAESIIKQIKALEKKVFTLFGYSQLEYQDKNYVMDLIREELKTLDPKTTIINIGATEEGIGAAYEIAKEMGFMTIGVASTLALQYSGKFSKFVDRIYIANDPYWGGKVPGTERLAETTRIYLQVSDVISAYGGGENTAAILREGKKLGMDVRYKPALMNKAVMAKLNKGKDPESFDLNGAAFYAWKELGGE